MTAGRFIPPKTPELKLYRSTKGDGQKDVKTQPDPPYMQPSSKGSKAVAAIPTEIWTEIFHLSLHFHSAGNGSAEPPSYPSPSSSLSHNPLIIAQVCRYWREIVFKDATFWTRIYVRVRSKSSEYANQMVLLQKRVDRSKDLPLSLTVVGEREEPLAHEKVPTPTEICDFIKKNHTRLHTLDITFSPIISRQYHTDILPLGDFPELQSLTLRAAEIGRNRYRPPRVTITAPKLSQMSVVGRMYVGGTLRSLPADSQHRDSSPYLTTKKAIIHEQHVIDFMKSFSKDEQNLHGGDGEEVAVVEEIYYTNECELATNPASFEHPQITLCNLTSFTAKFGAPSNCAWLLRHMQCSSLTTLDLVIRGQGPSPLADIGDFITRNGEYLQVLRLSAVDVHEAELLEVLSAHGGSLKELHLAHIKGVYAAGSLISNEMFRRLTPTLDAAAHEDDDYHECILPNLRKFSYVGHAKDLALSCILKMVERRATVMLSRRKERRNVANVAAVLDSFILKSKDCFAAEDPKVVRSFQGLLDEGHTYLHIEASGKPIVQSNRS
ncbi:hypothetical protein CVT25_006232 [Psilocybe cyanescens]|uniref:F-box domain-containing protein n=1 Tax=Psilocybe cyanescens TaxID=93625 RepID=A0A409XKK7_PSICY|nr:hypothetical protein CVT25_006232 [Psilocybe cyanescens]